MVHEILVTYLCWGCGSVVTEYEESDEQIPSKEVWNLCLDCRAPRSTAASQESKGEVHIAPGQACK